MSETVIQVLERTAREHPERPALRVKAGGQWRVTTWKEYCDQAFLAARGFLHLGLAPGEGVAILGYNRPEWFLADVAAIAAGGLPAGIYTSSTPEQCQYIAGHADAGIAIVENEAHLATFLALRERLPKLRHLILMTGALSGSITGSITGAPGVLTWQQLLEMGAGVPEADLRARIAAQKPEDVCTLIYTSGTTGPPKGVALSHHNITWMSVRIGEAFTARETDDLVSYLPLSHIAEQALSLHVPMAVGACSWCAESMEKLRENLSEIRPHFFFAVPRVWEKIQSAVQAAGAQNSGLKKKIAAWARGVGTAAG
jgi:long-subunit acyl-CoA synthetase (AMP-forming)